MSKDHTQEVQEYYGKTLQSGKDLKTNACCTAVSYPPAVKEALKLIHEEVKDRYYGCGLVIPQALEGMRILDLGSGAGRDCYIMSRLVGQKGHITGVDMTPEQLEVARRHVEHHRQAFGYAQSNVEFLEGNIEALDQVGLKADSFDIIVSNCVINLVNDKKRVLDEAYRVLKQGGELYFSDVYADKRIPSALAEDPVLYGECLSGALYWMDFITLAKAAGFKDPRLVEVSPITVEDPAVLAKLGDIKFYSVTCRLFKHQQMEDYCEDYGHQVTFLGNPEGDQEFVLDASHVFALGQAQKVCGNSYLMLKESRFAPYFKAEGDFSRHLGLMPGCGTSLPFGQAEGSCCSPGPIPLKMSSSCC